MARRILCQIYSGQKSIWFEFASPEIRSTRRMSLRKLARLGLRDTRKLPGCVTTRGEEEGGRVVLLPKLWIAREQLNSLEIKKKWKWLKFNLPTGTGQKTLPDLFLNWKMNEGSQIRGNRAGRGCKGQRQVVILMLYTYLSQLSDLHSFFVFFLLVKNSLHPCHHHSLGIIRRRTVSQSVIRLVGLDIIFWDFCRSCCLSR